MSEATVLALLKQARTVLERYRFDPDGERTRDDVAAILEAIEDALPPEGRVAPRRAELDRSALLRTRA